MSAEDTMMMMSVFFLAGARCCYMHLRHNAVAIFCPDCNPSSALEPNRPDGHKCV